MVKFTRFLCLSLIIAHIPGGLWADRPIDFKGDYFIYSDDFHYLYGGGNIRIEVEGYQISADSLYLDLNSFQGVIYGGISISGKGSVVRADLMVFKGYPFTFRAQTLGPQIISWGDMGLVDTIEKKGPHQLKKSDLYWEFSACKINKNKKIKAKMVFPHIFGLPSIPFKSFSITRGKIPEKTRFYFKNIGLSSLDGISLTFLYRMRQKFLSGDIDFKLYERELFDADAEIKRGLMLNGQLDWLVKKKKFINLSVLYNTGDDSVNFTLAHKKELKNISYSISQNISGRENISTVYQFDTWFMWKAYRFMSPRVSFTHNLKHSYSYGFSSPLKLIKNLNFNVNYLRKVIRDDVESDTQDYSLSMDFTSSLLSLSSSYNISENMLEATRSRNFTTNLKFKTLFFLNKNVSIDVSPFYMFSTLPGEEATSSRISPGINATIKSSGLFFPFGFKIVPVLTVNHVWDNLDIDQTEFNTLLSLKQEWWKFMFSLDYSLVSRYRSEGFWVEGYNVKNLKFSMEMKHGKTYNFAMRMYLNDDLKLENITFNGEIFLPWNIKFSSFLLYYVNDDKFQTIEVFIEKKFSNIFKLQCGYSLALKKFFIKFFTL
jgi:hypothetical protein